MKKDRHFKFDVDIRQNRGDMIMAYNILNLKVEMDARFMKINPESRTRGYTKKLTISQSKIEIRHFSQIE